MQKPMNMRILMYSILALCLSLVLFVEFYNFPSDIDMYNYEHGLSNGYKMRGSFLGLYVNFSTEGGFLAQALKVVLGVIPLVLIKSLLKQPLLALCDGHFVADGIRYFLIGIFAGIIWPLTFKFFAKIGRK